MQEFTLRNKTTNPILKLTPAMLKKVLAARPESCQLMLAKYRRDYKSLTGKTVGVDHDQHMILLQRVNADSNGMWPSRYFQLPNPYYHVMTIFQDGFLNRATSESLSKDLELAEAFYAMLDEHLPAESATA